ncbi:MAG TPA: hypothetical protein VIT67_22255 [Povalibacter sp.]
MSCCGHKRAHLFRAHSAAMTQAPVQPVAPLSPPRLFTYTGSGSATIRGASSGTLYRFDRKGASVEVASEDAFAMMAERDVQAQS